MSAAGEAAGLRRRPVTARRALVGLALAVVGLGSVFFSPAFYVLVLIVGLLSLRELSRLCDVKGQPLEYPVAIIGVMAYILMAVFGLLSRWEGALLAFIVLAAFWLGMYGEQKGYFARTAYTLLAVLYIGKLLTYFVFIRQVPWFGFSWTLLCVALIALSDTAAMLVGTAFGKHPMSRISPNKTIEGAIGAFVVVVGIGAALATLPPLGMLWWQGAALGAATSVAAQAGDLVESALKRDAGVKDSGSVIQGHGGVLDRFDSYLFGGMAFFGTLHILGLLIVS